MLYWLDHVVGQSSSDDEEDEGQDEKIVLNSEVVECFKKCLLWLERQQLLTLFRLCCFEE